MSTRSQCYIDETGIYLYKHWDGYELPNLVRNALKYNERWNDIEYLTRIIFDEMKKGNKDKLLGFGIGNKIHEDVEYLVSVYTHQPEGYITIEKNISDYDKSIESWETLFKGTFQEFVDNKRVDW